MFIMPRHVRAIYRGAVTTRLSAMDAAHIRQQRIYQRPYLHHWADKTATNHFTIGPYYCSAVIVCLAILGGLGVWMKFTNRSTTAAAKASGAAPGGRQLFIVLVAAARGIAISGRPIPYSVGAVTASRAAGSLLRRRCGWRRCRSAAVCARAMPANAARAT